MNKQPRWYDDIADILAEPDDDYLATLAAKNDRIFAALHDERGPLGVVDHALLNAWADSSSREWDVDPEAAA